MKRSIFTLLFLAGAIGSSFAQSLTLATDKVEDAAIDKHKIYENDFNYLGRKYGNQGNTGAITRQAFTKAGNAYGMHSDPKNNIDYDHKTGAISFIHRNSEPPVTGVSGPADRLAATYSLDTAKTWTTVEVFQKSSGGPGTIAYQSSNSRYPQGGLYVPPTAIKPSDVYGAFYGAGLDGSNPPNGAAPTDTVVWGAVNFGSYKLDGTNYVEDTFKSRIADSVAHIIASGYWVSHAAGKSYILLSSGKPAGTGPGIFYNKLLLYRGDWNDNTKKFDYTLTEIPADSFTDSPNSMQVAFAPAPNENVGYLTVMGHRKNGPNAVADSLLVEYLMVYKTTDFGQTWSWVEDVTINRNPDFMKHFYGDPATNMPRDTVNDIIAGQAGKATFFKDSIRIWQDSDPTDVSTYTEYSVGPSLNHDLVVTANGTYYVAFNAVMRSIGQAPNLNTYLPITNGFSTYFGKIFYVKGNGTAGSASVHYVADVNKKYTVYTPSSFATNDDSLTIFTNVNLTLAENGLVGLLWTDLDPTLHGALDRKALDPYTVIIGQNGHSSNQSGHSSVKGYLCGSSGYFDPAAGCVGGQFNSVIGEYHYAHVSPNSMNYFDVDSNRNGIEFVWVTQDGGSVDREVDIFYQKGFYQLEAPASALSVNEQLDQIQMTVFPNPASYSANFVIESPIEINNTQLIITNSLGQRISQKSIRVAEGRTVTPIDVQNLSSGVYLYTVQSNGFAKSGKFIVK